MSIKKISIIHHSHADYGYTDHPAVAAELQRQFVERALELIHKSTADCPFFWTSEVQEPIRTYWEAANGKQREELLSAIKSGAVEVCCLPFNMTPFLSREEWDLSYRWLPEELRKHSRTQHNV